MQLFITFLHILCAITIIALVLLQHGKGADAGASFGSGSSNTMFGSVGAMPFLMKITSTLALVFFATSIGLSYCAVKQGQQAQAVTLSATPSEKPSNNVIDLPDLPKAPINNNH